MHNSSLKKSRRNKLFDSIEQEAYLQLWRTYDRLREIETAVFQQHGFTAQQYNALRVLRSVSPDYMSTSALASRLVSRAPDMTRMLDKLEAKGLLARRRSRSNRRVVEVRLAPAGESLIQQLGTDVRRCGRTQLGHLRPERLRQLIELLKEARQPHENDLSTESWPGNQF